MGSGDVDPSGEAVLGSEGLSFSGLHSSFTSQLDDRSFQRLSTFIQGHAGIKLPPAKRVMLQSRLQKRLRALDMDSFAAYTDYVLSPEGHRHELVYMLDAVSTNKTDFFRENVHFEYMRDQVLPEYYGRDGHGGIGNSLKVWSAGCSSGQEAYTIAIVIEEFLDGRSFCDYSILGTDISTRMLQAARNAVYKEEVVAELDYELKRKYFLRSKDREHPTVRVVPGLRRRARFERLNFMDASYTSIRTTFDVIFCRNVLIYFDRETQEAVIGKLCEKLRSGGYFFLGHSESIMNMDLPLRPLRPTIFRRT